MKTLMVLGLVALVGCGKKDEERPKGEAPVEPKPIEAEPATPPAPTPPTPPAPVAVNNPDWPCAMEDGSNGAVDTRTTFKYEGPKTCELPPDLIMQGCPTLEEQDKGADGTIDRWRFLTYDDKGHVTTVDYRKELGGPVTTKLVYHYAADGTLEKMDVDSDADGTIDGNNVYEKKGEMMTRTFDRDLDGKPDLKAFSYYADGQIARMEIDHGADGKNEASAMYEYEGKRLMSETTVMGSVGITSKYLYTCK